MAFRLRDDRVKGFTGDIESRERVRVLSVIVLEYGGDVEVWSTLTDLCRSHGWSYHYLKRQKFPFEYKGIRFRKVPYRALNINL